MSGAAHLHAAPVGPGSCDLAEIFQRYGSAYAQQHPRRPGRSPIVGRRPSAVTGSGVRSVATSGSVTTVAATGTAPSVRARPRPSGSPPAGKNSCRCLTFMTCSRCRMS
jgi:hypothetical protein